MNCFMGRRRDEVLAFTAQSDQLIVCTRLEPKHTLGVLSMPIKLVIYVLNVRHRSNNLFFSQRGL